jgi:hypothetical protein
MKMGQKKKSNFDAAIAIAIAEPHFLFVIFIEWQYSVGFLIVSSMAQVLGGKSPSEMVTFLLVYSLPA